jgi:hypothetical protein
MNVLDENISISQRNILKTWRIPAHHIGYDIGRKGMKDDEIIPLLLTLTRPTFFTLDWDYLERDLCHARYCLIYLDVRRDEVASFVRRVLQHPRFNTHTKRMGTVIRAAYSGLAIWHLHAEQAIHFTW